MPDLICPICLHHHGNDWSNAASACLEMCAHGETEDGGGCACTQPIEVALLAQQSANTARLAAAAEGIHEATVSGTVALWCIAGLLQAHIRGTKPHTNHLDAVLARAIPLLSVEEEAPPDRPAAGDGGRGEGEGDHE